MLIYDLNQDLNPMTKPCYSWWVQHEKRGGVLKGSNGKENLSDYKSLGLSQNLKRKDIFVRCTKPLCIHEMHNYHLIIINKSIILSITDRQKQN